MFTLMNATPTLAYERVEQRLRLLIQRGTLRPGDRMPSIREICRTEKVSPGTAVQALSNLEACSLVRARPRSGFYVEAPLVLPVPVPDPGAMKPVKPGVSEDAARVFLDLARPGNVALGAGVADSSLLPAEEIARSVARAARLGAPHFARYTGAAVDLPLRREVARRLALRGCSAGPEEIVIAHGCMEAVNLSLRAVARPGDTVIVESPTYFGLLELIENLGMKALPVPSATDCGLDLAALEKALRRYRVAACLLIPSFGNPNGALMPQSRRDELGRLLARHEVPLIEDDIYGELPFEGDSPRPVKAGSHALDTLLCGSLSKTLSPDLRIGWVAAGRRVEDVRRQRWISSIATPSVTTRAACDYLQSGHYDRHLRSFRRLLGTQMSRISHAVAGAFPPGTAMSRPRGGYMLWVELPRRVDALALRDAALREKISICPGPIFCAEGGHRHFIRLNCALPWNSVLQKALETLGSLASELNAPVVAAGKRA